MTNEYVVIDTETTGVFKKDRIVEIALVLVKSGSIKEYWSTLINPMRDISNSEIHGITPSMVSAAPTFSEVANDIARFINGRILVGHNVGFDIRMLHQEFDRMNLEVNFGSNFCTMIAARRFTGLSNCSLTEVCREFNIQNENIHSALSDAMSTAHVFKLLQEDKQEIAPASITVDLTALPARTLTREAFTGEISNKQKHINDFINKVPFPTSEQRFVAYLQLLNLVLQDLHISDDEWTELRSWARDLQIDESELDALHTGYLESFLQAALRDNEVTTLERDILGRLSYALGIEIEIPESANLIKSVEGNIKSGMKVCFTGEATKIDGNRIPRFELETLAAKFGLYPVSSVSARSCNLLVAVDTTSMSGKAKKAREAGIPIISIDQFLLFCSVEL